MVRAVENAETQNFVNIAVDYPNEYILTKVVEIDYNKGREKGIALYTGESRDELVSLIQNNSVTGDTIILQGINLIPVLGGLL